MQDALGAVQSLLVLGGTSEIAASIAQRVVERRCQTVVLAARDTDATTGLAIDLERRGAKTVETIAFDALDIASHEKVIGQVFENHDIDLVILAFGVLGDQADFDEHPAAAAKAVEVNYVGGVSAGLVTARQFRRQGHGTLVVLSSVAAERARQTNFVYGSSKAGLDAFAQGLGDSLAGSGARVMAVRPGFVHTRMTEGMEPQPFSTTPDVVASAVIRGLARGSHTVWAPSILRWVFALMRHLPRPVWQKISAR
ncbi:MAG: decaprenylphospho-beta-D-erythro-pentofuranosid-2-ulose 2-reductase [Actinobacteria bacterium]|nr:decaprenylphospho-beta-D-erythro-pentofuranosid-2-ulose 2-reductase [Actinomycetota bacterium]